MVIVECGDMRSDDIGWDYVRQSLDAATRTLVGSGTVQDRLESAGMSLLRLHMNDPPFITDEEHARWSQIMETLAARGEVASEHEGHQLATIREMSDDQAAHVAREILELHELHLINLARKGSPDA